MTKQVIIGDHTKDEWISVLDTEKKKLEFTNHIATAKIFNDFDFAKGELRKLQETGYFTDLQIYIKGEDGKAHRPDERDMIPW